ncbi:MAG: glycosyltransferase family 9 protein [Bacteroidetes bacterium]|nr:glycosyltransferase family 9 protein [Bacteroidota bacterium]
MNKNYKKFLIIQTAFIGDAILASSLIEKLHAISPVSEISILVRKGNEGIYHLHPFLKEILIWDKSKNKIKNLLSLLYKVRKQKYDVVINCHRYASSGIIAGFSNAKHIAGYKQNPFSFLFNVTAHHSLNNNLHEIERYNLLIEDFTNTVIFKPKLYTEAIERGLSNYIQQSPYVCMAPASVWFTKQLPEKKWIELINLIPEQVTIFVLGGNTDVELCERIIKSAKHKKINNLSGKLNLLQSAALMKNAKMNYVNDSAPLHLCSATNASVTAFFCSTVTGFGFGPLSNKQTIIEVQNLSCRPCGIHGFKSCPKKHFNCGNEINLSKLNFDF